MAIASSSSFQPKVVVAIDFGTHGSGFAWAPISNLQDRPDTRVIIYQDFTSFGGVGYPKDLTAVLVDRDRRPLEFGFQARRKWMQELTRGNPDGLGYAVRFKMAIRSDAPTSDVPRFHGSLAGADRAAVKGLITYNLRHLREAALRSIKATGEQGIAYEEADIRWCITVPAIWSDNEKSLMRDAAAAAGLPADQERLLLVQEPEAAAVYCAIISGTLLGQGRPADHLNVSTAGSRFMVVDCGGGTVDITGYQIRPEGAGDGRLKEIGIADGGPLGSAYINNAFVQHVLADRFGEAQLKRLQAQFPGDLAKLEDSWESEKVSSTSETGRDGTPFFTDHALIDVPPRIWAALDQETQNRLIDLASGEDYQIVVTPGEVAELFDSVVEAILKTIARQREIMLDEGPVSGADQIIIVGGFARSTYLRDCIAQRFGDEIRVLVAHDPAVAVLAGAVHFAYDPSIIWGRRSKYTYGYGCGMTFRPGRDPQSKHFVNYDGKDSCNARFGVMVERGQVVPVNKTYSHEMHISKNDPRRTYEIELYATYSTDPEYTDEEGCMRVGMVPADVSGGVGTERYLDINFSFGQTEIQVETFDALTGIRKNVPIAFDDLYGRRR